MTAPPHHYIDPVVFTRLFKARKRNHSQICVELNTIAEGVADRFHFPTVDQRDEARQNTVQLLIRKISKFVFGSTGTDNAYSYYTRIAFSSMSKEMRSQERHWARMPLFVDAGVGDKTEGLRPYTHAA